MSGAHAASWGALLPLNPLICRPPQQPPLLPVLPTSVPASFRTRRKVPSGFASLAGQLDGALLPSQWESPVEDRAQAPAPLSSPGRLPQLAGEPATELVQVAAGGGATWRMRSDLVAAVRASRQRKREPQPVAAFWTHLLGTDGRPALVYQDTVPYFAYGSNLNLDLLRRRTGGSEILAAEPGQVADHRLAFNVGGGVPLLEPAMAAIEPEVGHEVHGLLTILTRRQYDLLYLSEGGAVGPARAYLEHEVTVNTYSGCTVQAVALRANPVSPLALPKGAERVPSTRYKNLLLRGARDIGLRPSYISYLESIPAPFGIVWRPASSQRSESGS